MIVLLGVCVQSFSAQEQEQKPLTGEGAAITFFGQGEVDAFRPGAKVFSDRDYTINECPEWLQGKKFLRNSISDDRFFVTEDGLLTILTPQPTDDPHAAPQCKTLEKYGFLRVNEPETFQLFGKQSFDTVRIYQKKVKKGDKLNFRKWTVVLGFQSAEPVVNKPWSENQGERIYNGIVLPKQWPPMTIDPRDDAPMAVPYLDAPPKVIPIDIGRQLFVDDFLIEKTDMKRIFHKPEKYEGNPILKPETELELHGDRDAAAVPKSGGVWWDPQEKIFKMWYEAGWINTICYATSKDGLKWDRPELDVNPGTNQVLPMDLMPDSWTVVPDWDAKDPQQRYKMFMRSPGGNIPGVSMTSADGIHWVNRTETGITGDRSTMFYNPFRKKWVYTLRSHFRGRSAHYRECDDFLEGAKWKDGEPVAWAAADRDDPVNPSIGCRPQLYALNAVAYESILLGSYEIHHGPPNKELMKKGLPKITGVNFAYSRDGFHWSRPDRQIHIPSEEHDVWDRGYVQPIGNLCCIRGDKLWFYYSAFQGDPNKIGKTHPTIFNNGMYDRGSTGLAFLRRDGFVSMEAWSEPGTLTTRPVVFSGKQVFVNAATSLGELRVEILDEAGKPIAPFTLENCNPISCDSTLEPVTWKGADSVAALAGRPVRFRFTLQDGALYAFWVSRDATGRSDGYVAGGGPGFTGMTDTVGRVSLEAEQKVGQGSP